MALKIPAERIASGDLTDYERDYLQTRGRLPEQQGAPRSLPLEEQDSPTIGDNGGIDDNEEEEDYLEGWNNNQRRAELARRKLSVDGNKTELIERLLRYDADELLPEDHATIED